MRPGQPAEVQSDVSLPVYPAARLLRQTEVTARTGMSRSTLYAKIERGEFPEPVRLGSRFSRWREEDVADWIREPR
jgi:prophage regulatory protein